MKVAIGIEKEIEGLEEALEGLSSFEKIKVIQVEVEENERNYLFSIYVVHPWMRDLREEMEEKELLRLSIPVYFKMGKRRDIDLVLLIRAIKNKIKSVVRRYLKDANDNEE